MNWQDFIAEEMKKEYFINLSKFLRQEEKSYTIYPKKEDIFNAFNLFPIDKVKCMILAQDPYHGENQAHGLSFSVQKNISIPPSLRNIFKELKNDLNIDPPSHGDLSCWAEQGVLLLNSILTVRKGEPASHRERGWEIFTDNAIKLLNDLDRPIVFILMGAFAKSKSNLITNNKHLILQSSHPSPMASNQGGFFGTKHFSKTNDFLLANNISPIDWSIK